MDTYLNAYPRKETFNVGDVLKFSCSQGRIMVGADSVQCYHFGWSPKLPTCEGKYLSDNCWSKNWDFRYQPFYFPPLIFCPLSVHLYSNALRQRYTHQRGEGNGNPLQYSCLDNPGDREAWWAAVYGVAQSQTRLKRLCSSIPTKDMCWVVDTSVFLL